MTENNSHKYDRVVEELSEEFSETKHFHYKQLIQDFDYVKYNGQ